MKALSGEQVPGVGGVGTQLQAQVSTIGWRIDDLLLTGEANGPPRRLAMSAKGNQQVSASGLPSDFVTRAWERCVTRISHFLTTTFGASLRLDGLRWIAAMLKAKDPSNHWYREGTGNALVELVAAALSSDAQVLSKDAEARHALVEVAAALTAKDIPAALALQERIKLLR